MVRVRNVLITANPCGRNEIAITHENGNTGDPVATVTIAVMVAYISTWAIIVILVTFRDKNCP